MKYDPAAEVFDKRGLHAFESFRVFLLGIRKVRNLVFVLGIRKVRKCVGVTSSTSSAMRSTNEVLSLGTGSEKCSSAMWVCWNTYGECVSGKGLVCKEKIIRQRCASLLTRSDSDSC